jgi:uncharacterized protein (DUF302 family)
MNNFCITKQLKTSFFEAIDDTILLFGEYWYWVVSNIDVSEKIRKKNIDNNFWEYRIIWMCKPQIAYKFFEEDFSLWVFMPCSVCVYEKESKVFVSAWLPEALFGENIKKESSINLAKELNKEIEEIISKI